MMYKGYYATIRYSEEDRLFVGEILGLVDTLGFHGSSVDELEQMFHQSIDNYLALCDRLGRLPDKQYRGQFNVRISSQLHRKAVFCAAKRNLSLNEFVAEAIEDECQKIPLEA